MSTTAPTSAPTAPHQALYRRWRAQTFSEIVGQAAVVETLRNAVRADRVSHAILFVGPRGTGKTSLARILAKALNCTNLRDGDPCDACTSCVAIREGRALDLVEIDAASNRGIDAIRELRERINYAPTDLRRKVYILDEAHQITKDAWNALLKSLEEPPDFVAFMFASTHPQDFPPAILSRLQRYDVRRLTVPEIEGKLERILAAESVEAEPAAVHLIARLAAGGMRDAESMLDQLLGVGRRTDRRGRRPRPARPGRGRGRRSPRRGARRRRRGGRDRRPRRARGPRPRRRRRPRPGRSRRSGPSSSTAPRARRRPGPGRRRWPASPGASPRSTRSGAASAACGSRSSSRSSPHPPARRGRRSGREPAPTDAARRGRRQAPPERPQPAPRRRAATPPPTPDSRAPEPPTPHRSRREPAPTPPRAGRRPPTPASRPPTRRRRRAAPPTTAARRAADRRPRRRAAPPRRAPTSSSTDSSRLGRTIVASVRPGDPSRSSPSAGPMAVDGNVVTLGFPEAKAFLKDVAERKRGRPRGGGRRLPRPGGQPSAASRRTSISSRRSRRRRGRRSCRRGAPDLRRRPRRRRRGQLTGAACAAPAHPPDSGSR